MPPELIALIDKPHLLIAVLLVGAFAGMTFEQFRSKMRRQKWLERNRSRWQKKRTGSNIDPNFWLPERHPESSRQPDAADQLRIVMGATFTTQPLLNKSEARLFKEVDRIEDDEREEDRVQPQRVGGPHQGHDGCREARARHMISISDTRHDAAWAAANPKIHEQMVAFAAADGVGCFVDTDRAPGTEQGDRCGQAVGPRADDDGIEVRIGRRFLPSVAEIPAEDIVRKGIVQVIEGRPLFRHLTVEENLMTGVP